MSKLTIESPAFENYGTIPDRYACGGDNVSPPFVISNVPKEAKSLALIMDDPDAPGGTWAHWLKWNIPPNTTELREDEEPDGRTGVSSSGTMAYHGPCPIDGVHHYVFKLFALDEELELENGATRSELLDAMEGHILDKSTLTGLYKRKDHN